MILNARESLSAGTLGYFLIRWQVNEAAGRGFIKQFARLLMVKNLSAVR